MKRKTNKNPIRTIYCGVEDSDGNPVKMSKEQEEEFIKNMSCNGKINVVFRKDSAIPNMMKSIAGINKN